MIVRIACALLCMISSLWAWKISGKVTDIRGKPVNGAQVCEQGNSSNCVSAGADGAFSISGTATSTRSCGSVPQSDHTFSLLSRAGRFFISAPAAGPTQIEWFDASGRRLASEDRSNFVKGMNRLGRAPASSGIVFLRLSSGSLRRMWKTAAGGIGQKEAAISPVAAERPTYYARTAEATPVITASNTGFKPRNYYAVNPALDTLAWIILAATQDDSTYKFGGTSYPVCAIPPNTINNGPKCFTCTVYSGLKFGDCKAPNCSITINNVFAPKDSTFLVLIGFNCAANHGYSNCKSRPGSKATGCRPVQFKINNQTFPDSLITECYAGGDWCHDLYDSIPLPLKAGLNSIELFSVLSDMPNFSRIAVRDGRVY